MFFLPLCSLHAPQEKGILDKDLFLSHEISLSFTQPAFFLGYTIATSLPSDTKACCIASAYCLLPCASQSLQFARDAGEQLNSSAQFLVKKLQCLAVLQLPTSWKQCSQKWQFDDLSKNPYGTHDITEVIMAQLASILDLLYNAVQHRQH